jgi:hypothetical protein
MLSFISRIMFYRPCAVRLTICLATGVSQERIIMKQISTLAAVAIVAAITFVGAACLADTITVMKGTNVPLVFDQAVSSKTAKKGDIVNLHVATDVSIGDKTIFKAGEKVTAVITTVQHRKNFGVNAKLRLKFNPVETTFGPAIEIQAKSKGSTTGSRTDEAAAISGGSAILLGPIGLVGGYFVVGKQVNIKKDDLLISEVARDFAIVK